MKTAGLLMNVWNRSKSFVVAWMSWCMLTSAFAASSPDWENLADPVLEPASPLGQQIENSPTHLAQDRYGFIWIGTPNGLVRFDGYRYRYFRPKPEDPAGLPGGDVICLAASSQGGLWIGTLAHGLVYRDPVSERFTTFKPTSTNDSSSRVASIRAIAIGPDGTLWIGGDRGLDHFDPRSGRFTTMNLVSGVQPRVLGILIDSHGTLWVQTVGDGVFRRPAKQTEFIPVVLPNKDQRNFGGIIEDSQGRIWVNAISKVTVLDVQGRLVDLFRNIPSDSESIFAGDARSIAEVRPGVMWIGFRNGGISIIDIDRRRTRRMSPNSANTFGLQSGTVPSLLRDRSGLIWIANYDGGLLRHNPGNSGVMTLLASNPRAGLPDKNIVSVIVDRENHLWTGGINGALAAISSAGGRVGLLHPHPGSSVQALELDAQGTLWAGDAGWLCKIDRKRFRTVCPTFPASLEKAVSQGVWGILADQGSLWIGTNEGLFHWYQADNRIKAYQQGNQAGSLSSNTVQTIYMDRRRRIWGGTPGPGLNLIDPGANQVRRFIHDAKDPRSLGPGWISSILEDKAGRIWVGSNGGAVSILEQNGDDRFAIRRLGVAQGMREVVNSLAEDARGRIWASTDKGVILIDPVNVDVRNFELADGVAISKHWDGSSATSTDGTIFFAGSGGVTVIQPDKIGPPWTYAPPLVITELQIARKRISEGLVIDAARPLTLEPDGREITAEFSALDYSAPEKSRYQYLLEGYDSHWVETDASNRRATYTNLPPGTFTLRVRGSNRLGAWSPHEIALPIVVTPTWHETWWFRTLVVLLTGLLLLAASYAWYRRRMVRLQRQYELDNLAVRAQAELETASMQQRFVALVSHEMRNPLSLIGMTLKNLQRMGDVPTSIVERHQKIDRAYQRLQTLINNYLAQETLHARHFQLKKQELDMHALLEEVVGNARLVAQHHRIDLVMPPHLPLLVADHELLYLVLSNLIDNAVKYSPQGSHIAMRASASENEIEIAVQDSGIGIGPEDLPHIFDQYYRVQHGHAEIKAKGVGLGLHLVKQIVELHGGTIEVESQVGAGSTFRVRLVVVGLD